jgi:AcrR family transcriptional regulator
MSRAGNGRGKLVAATKELLWERGYEQMSPRDVLDRSGTGQGSLYHHFPTKLALAEAALKEMVAEEMAAMDAIFAPGKPPLLRLSDYLARRREALRGCRIGRLANETVMEAPELRRHVSAYLDGVEGLIGQAIAEGQAEKSLATDLDAQALGAVFLSIIEGGFVLARAHWDPARMERALSGAEAVLKRLLIPSNRCC